MSNKKAQATIVIIIALVMGATILGAYYTKEYIIKSQWEREFEKSSQVPPQAQNIYDFTIDCLQQTADQATEIAGSQAGYINLPQDPLNPIIPIEKNNLRIIGSLETPYWHYINANNIPTEQIPSKEQIQTELSSYIDQNINNCLNNYIDFQQYQTEQSDPKTEAIIKSNQILIKTNLQLKIKRDDFEFDFKPFYTQIKKPLGYLYDQAIEILETELTENFLEEKTLDVMATYEEIPFSGETDDCAPPFWIKENIIEKFKTKTSDNIQFIKIKNTNYQLPEDLKYFEVDSGINDKELNVNFLYIPSWPNHIEIEPSEQGILKAQSITEMLGQVRAIVEPFVCRSVYNFVYNIKYPVLVSLSKNDYNFNFATQVIIDHNEPRENLNIPESIPEQSTRVCENKRFDGTITTLSENNPLDDVSINYKCITHQCNIGYTKLNDFGDSELRSKFPICHQGSIIATKQGYHPLKETVSTTEDFAITLNLEKYKTLKVESIIQRAGSGEPQEGETIIIQLFEEEKQHNIFLNYPEQTEIQLIPGTYKTKLYLIKDYPEEITIPKREVEKCIDVPKKSVTGLLGATEEKCTKIKIPAISVEQTITGAAEQSIKITEQDLTKSKVKFYIPYKGIPRKAEGLVSQNEKFTQPVFE